MTGTVLVAGGAGYIGSHVCKALAEAGFRPLVYDSLERGHADLVQWGELEQGDILDRARLDRVIEQHRPRAAVHCAGLINVGESVVEPALYRRVNVDGSRCLIRALADHGVAHLVFSSTAAVYAAKAASLIPETAELAPSNPYGETKLAVERLLAQEPGLSFAALRFFNAAGADPEARIGERHDPETHALPLAILAAMGRSTGFQIMGTDYPTPDGTAVRDYVHVDDLADAHVLALQRLLAGNRSITVNLGSGSGTSVRELVDAVGEVVGRTVPYGQANRRPGDPATLVADIRAARAQLGWVPRRSDLRTIIETAWRWHEKDAQQAAKAPAQSRL